MKHRGGITSLPRALAALAGLAVLAGPGSGTALAQDAGLTVSVGARAWLAEWTTFSYYAPNGPNEALTQVSADRKLVVVPTLGVRYGEFTGTLSALPSTSFTFADGGSGKRQEFDLNVGYTVLPGLTATLGYKKVSQRDGSTRYEPAGPVFGISANAPLSGAFSMYGALAFGRLKTPTTGGDEVVKFKADYRLTEVGLAWSSSPGIWPRRWTFTTGYRIQVMGSKEAFGTQDGRDTTQGLTLGALATF
jgi:hypothetical protein